MEKATFALIMVVIGGLIFALTVLFVVNLVTSGWPVYDSILVRRNSTRTETFRPADAYTLPKGTRPKVISLGLIEPSGQNYNLSLAAWGNSSFILLLLDETNYRLYNQSAAHKWLGRIMSQGENRTVAITITAPVTLHIVIENSRPQANLFIVFSMNHSFLYSMFETRKEMNILWSYLVPAVCFVGFAVMLIGFFTLRSEARAARQASSEEPTIYTYEGQ